MSTGTQPLITYAGWRVTETSGGQRALLRLQEIVTFGYCLMHTHPTPSSESDMSGNIGIFSSSNVDIFAKQGTNVTRALELQLLLLFAIVGGFGDVAAPRELLVHIGSIVLQ